MSAKRKDFSGEEKRKSVRRPVLETFSVAVVVPQKGLYRLPISDVSEQGILFDLDVEGDTQVESETSAFSIENGEVLEILFYLNQSLSFPLKVKVARILEVEREAMDWGDSSSDTKGKKSKKKNKIKIRQLGTELTDIDSEGPKAFQAFINLLDCVVKIGQINQSPEW